MDEDYLKSLIDRVRPHTMVWPASLHSLAHLVEYVLDHDIPGDFVECGTWKGGCSFLIADILKHRGVEPKERLVWMFDSFEGMPAPTPVDGERAQRFVRETDSPRYYDNYKAEIGEVVAAARALGLRLWLLPVKGWFNETLPNWSERTANRPIALLRVDCDWYESVSCALSNLRGFVAPGGFIVLDDYYWFEGARKAFEDFRPWTGWSGVHSVYSASASSLTAESAWIQRVKETPRDFDPRTSIYVEPQEKVEL